MSTLAEIIEEGKRLEEAYLAGQCAMRWDALVSFRHRNFPRLLAVAEAAVEARIVIKSIIDAHNARLTDGGKLIYSPPTMGTGFIGAIEWLAAFDAAASGEGRE